MDRASEIRARLEQLKREKEEVERKKNNLARVRAEMTTAFCSFIVFF